jgi:uncharacterized surface protein with fasciclin (FAS1) repeats
MKDPMLHISRVVIAMGIILSSSCKKEVNPYPDTKMITDPNSISGLIGSNFNLTHYDTSLILTGLTAKLGGKGPYTVFAPEDDGYPTDGYGRFYYYDNFYYMSVQQGDPNYLSRVASYHVLPGNYKKKDIPFAFNTSYPTLTGQSLFISQYIKNNDTVVTVNGVKVKAFDQVASNGTIHVLSSLLFPPPNTTVWNVLSGSQNISWQNEILLNYIGTYFNPGTNCRLFAAALKRTGLDKLLQGPDQYTVFAPVDGAFVNPNNGNAFTIDSINAQNVDTLARILKLHILPGVHFINDFLYYPFNPTNMDPSNGNSIPLNFATVGSDSLHVIPNGYDWYGNFGFFVYGRGNYQNGSGIRIGIPDVVAPNGVIHFIGTELLP